MDELTPERVTAIRALAEAATKGPWYVQNTDDGMFMNALYISTFPPSEEPYEPFYLDVDNPKTVDYARVVAITLLQYPRLVCPPEFDENTKFIAAARSDVPALCDALEAAWAENTRHVTMAEDLDIVTGGLLGDVVISLPSDDTSDAWLARDSDGWTLYTQDGRGINNSYLLTPERVEALLNGLTYVRNDL